MASEWQPIETAPKDGRDVLLFWEAEHGAAFVRYWAIGRWVERNGSGMWLGESFHSEPYGYWTRILGERPSHWQPLNAPPVTP